jgi:hypothetical protein
MLVGENISEEVSIGMPPLDLTMNYPSMYAFENHLQVANVKKQFSIANSRVAITFKQECCSHSNDPNPIMASIEYIGWIEKNLELNYGLFQTIVFFCN